MNGKIQDVFNICAICYFKERKYKVIFTVFVKEIKLEDLYEQTGFYVSLYLNVAYESMLK